MTIIELRNAVVKELHTAMAGPKVVLSDQDMPEADYPYIYYQFTSPHMSGPANKLRIKTGDTTARISRVEQPTASLSFTACSINHDGISGDDEALEKAEKAKAFFMHTGRETLAAQNIVVVSVGNIQPRTAPGIIETDRRYGFDVIVRYERTDNRDVAVMDSPAIIIKED